MKPFKQVWILFVVLVLVSLGVGIALRQAEDGRQDPRARLQDHRAHLDHSVFFAEAFATGQEVTRACLECHEAAGRAVLGTAHFMWLGDEVVTDDGDRQLIGKKNLINNYCISIQGNWASCTRCHAGYGWEDQSYDFSLLGNVDCLVCHDRSGTYLKGAAGNPRAGVDLQAAAKSVGYPKRDNCGVCHAFGGGGLGVKHGDLDSTLDNPDASDDVHMGREAMLCIDCHGGDGHNIRGKGYSVSVTHENGIGCDDCHDPRPHDDVRLNQHTERVACQTCHIPSYANRIPTKMDWDWSLAGDDSREDDPHHYLKIKGEFIYDSNITPEYHWFDLTMDRYLLGDKVPAAGPVRVNYPRGQRGSEGAKIWPFKVHRGKQPYDVGNRVLVPPVTSGEGGFWHDFDWAKALALGAEVADLDYSGEYDFIATEMYWPLSHLVQAAERTLQCNDCHGTSRLDWPALGYEEDPIKTGTGASAPPQGGPK